MGGGRGSSFKGIKLLLVASTEGCYRDCLAEAWLQYSSGSEAADSR